MTPTPLALVRLLTLLSVLLLAVPVFAQRGSRPNLPGRAPKEYGIKSKKAAEAYENAMVAFGYGDYAEALAHLENALQAEPGFELAIYKRGESLYALAQRRKAIQSVYTQYMRDVLQTLEPLAQRYRSFNPKVREMLFYLGEANAGLAKYAEAARYYTLYLDTTIQVKRSFVPDALLARRKAQFAADAMAKPIQFVPRNLGATINTKGDEYMAYPTADDQLLFFTSRREGSTGGLQMQLRDYGEDFYVSERQADGSWGNAVNIGEPINTPENEGASCISPDGQTVIFTACNRPSSMGSCDLYMAHLEGTKWSLPRNLGAKVNSRAWESHPNLSHDGRTLYFASARAGGLGGVDIWYSTWTGTEWGQPKNMGAPVNTSGDENGPFLAADGVTLYFSSDGHLGFGGRDMFLSRKTRDGTWGTPVNLGYPLNTPGDEQNLAVSANGKRAYINSDAQTDTYGRVDLYEFDLDSTIRPLPATYVRGTVRDSLTLKAIGNARVQFIDLFTGDTVRDVLSNTASGKFLLSLPLEREYAAFTEAAGYLYLSQNFSLADLRGAPYFDLDLRLVPIRVGATAVLRNVFFDFNSTDLLPQSQVELHKLVRFLTSNPKLRVEIRGHTDAEGTAGYNTDLSNRRALAVRKFLTDAGVAPERLLAKGYGEGVPIATNDTEAGRSLNRRTEFRILGQ